MSSPGEDLRNEIDRLHRAAGGQSQEPRASFTEAQSRASPTYAAFGEEGAPAALAGEPLQDYRVRLLSPFKPYSARYKDADLSKVNDPGVFSSVEADIFKDAVASLATRTYKPDELHPVRRADSTGRILTSWRGHNMAAWAAFTPPPRYAKFLTPSPR
jgi:hypothetical protein